MLIFRLRIDASLPIALGNFATFKLPRFATNWSSFISDIRLGYVCYSCEQLFWGFYPPKWGVATYKGHPREKRNRPYYWILKLRRGELYYAEKSFIGVTRIVKNEWAQAG